MDRLIDIKKLLHFISDNMNVESGFLTPHPQASINVVKLIYEIAILTQSDKE